MGTLLPTASSSQVQGSKRHMSFLNLFLSAWRTCCALWHCLFADLDGKCQQRLIPGALKVFCLWPGTFLKSMENMFISFPSALGCARSCPSHCGQRLKQLTPKTYSEEPVGKIMPEDSRQTIEHAEIVHSMRATWLTSLPSSFIQVEAPPVRYVIRYAYIIYTRIYHIYIYIFTGPPSLRGPKAASHSFATLTL